MVLPNKAITHIMHYNSMISYKQQLNRLYLIACLYCFNIYFLDILSVIKYKIYMRDKNYFLHPVHDWQRRYEAMRASFVERLPAKVVAYRFDYSPSYIHLLRHQFIHEKIDFSEPVAEGKTAWRRVTSKIRFRYRTLFTSTFFNFPKNFAAVHFLLMKKF